MITYTLKHGTRVRVAFGGAIINGTYAGPDEGRNERTCVEFAGGGRGAFPNEWVTEIKEPATGTFWLTAHGRAVEHTIVGDWERLTNAFGPLTELVPKPDEPTLTTVLLASYTVAELNKLRADLADWQIGEHWQLLHGAVLEAVAEIDDEDAECTCAMTEATMTSCAVHGYAAKES